MEYFLIILDNPHAKYYPGQAVSGRVIFKSRDEENTKGIFLECEGQAIVHWTETNAVRTGQIRHGSTSFDNTDTFFESHLFLDGDGQNSLIIPAWKEISYRFYIQLPKSNLLTSFIGDFGKVEYILRATIKRPFWKFDYKTKQSIDVNSIVDPLTYDPVVALPGEWKAYKTFCCLCCASGPLSINVKLQRKGFCVGEVIVVEIYIDNGSSREISELSAEIIQQFTFFAEGEKKKTSTPIVTANKGQPLQPYDIDFWRAELPIPLVPPTNLGGCRIINLDYVVKVEAHVSGTAANLRQICPIIIGTVPLGSDNYWKSPDSIFITASAPPLHTLANAISHF